METLESAASRNRYAIMGGTFDPIHFGHLAAAEAVREKLQCTKVIFIPTGNPPHKTHRIVTASKHRYAMASQAVSSNPYFEVSDIEIKRKGYTYTFDTIKELKRLHGNEIELLFITGADALLEIETWYKVKELLRQCSFVAVTRPGYDKTKLEQKLSELRSKYKGVFFIVDVPGLNISSTDIRARMIRGSSIRYLLPETVAQYIFEKGLYNKN
jgi:nicotinate-nucleotide adenylyltransferase